VPRSRPAVGLGIGVAAAIVIVLLNGGCGGSGDTTTGTAVDRTNTTRPPARGPVQVSLAGLRDLADSVGHPVYWAGERSGSHELTVDVNGNIFIRYLRAGEPAGSRKSTSLTIATYPFANAFETLRSAASRPGAASGHILDGGLVVAAGGSPRNAYIAYPDRDIQVEVYDPHPSRALELATAGAIVPIR
jgi:hypothetical protein